MKLSKYLAVARTTALANLIYDRDLFIRSLFMLVALVVFVQLWTTTYSAVGQVTIAGFNLRGLVWYLVVTELIALGTPRIAQTIDAEVRSGDVAYALARPYGYVPYQLARYWGETILRLPINALLGSCVALVAVGPPDVTPLGLVAGLIAAAGAITLKGSMEILIGLSAFWVEDTQPVEWMYSKLNLTVGGIFLPLDLFPDWLAAFARALPFASIAYAPARVFVSFSWASFAQAIATQLVWIVAVWLALILVFGRAVRRMTAHGG